MKKINCGVPQGSILGPIRFLLYINDLASVSEFCFSVLFADDTNMFITGKDMNVLCRQLKVDHNKKTKVMSFSWKSPEIFQEVHGFHPCKANGGLPCLVLRYLSTI